MSLPSRRVAYGRLRRKAKKSFIQTEVQAGAIKVFSVKGTENPADIFTKNLDLNSTLKHMQALGLRSTLLPEGVRGLAAASSVLRACVVRETPNLRERFRPNSQHKWLFVEFCAPLLSGFARVCAREFPRVHVLTVTASDDGTKKETCEDLLRIFKEAREFNSMHRGMSLSETEPQQIRNGVPEAS